jgi:hypothetical protein
MNSTSVILDGSLFDSDDPETFKNAPVCLQLVGRTLEEEAVIKMTEIVDAALAAAKGGSALYQHRL